MKKLLVFAAAAVIAAPVFADVNSEEIGEDNNQISEFVSDETTEEGFITHYLNNSIAAGMAKADDATEVEYGRKVTSYVSAPKFGGYFIGKYDYNDQDGTTKNGGFSQRLIRFYVDGKILNDFAYRIQIQTNNSSFHMKDFFLEWQKYSEFKVKIGQFKRAFTFENPMNPWDVGVGDYSQAIKKLAGMGDICGEDASCGGRDQGLQVQGDLFPVGSDQHRLVHYQVMVANGQGINAADVNKHKDVLATIQLQPIKGLFVGFFGWTGKYGPEATAVNRNRYAISAKYDANDWTARAEYIHHTGEYKAGIDKADAWYATVGVPCTPWLKTYVKWDVFRADATSETAKSIYSICPNFQLHKNLMFQVQYNFVHDKTNAKDQHYNELWLETYVRF